MKLWQRYVLRKISLTFCLLLFCLFSLYILVDLSVNGVRFFTRGPSIGLDILLYYCLQFALRLDLFLPFAFLLALLKTLLDMNSHLELVALQTAGLSRKRLLLPFFTFAFCLTLISYANHEWITAYATKDVNAFKRSKSRKAHHTKPVQLISLNDGSDFIYHSFDANKNEFFDVFWIRSAKEIWAMKSVVFRNEKPLGHFVELFLRNSKGTLERTECYPQFVFSEMPTSVDLPGENPPISGRCISYLWCASFQPSVQKCMVLTHLHRKLSLPLLPLLGVVAIAPFAMTFSRQKRIFLLTACTIFGFALFMTFYDALVILGENQMISAPLAMWLPIVAAMAFFSKRFWKL